MSHRINVYFYFLLITSSAKCANILALFPVNEISHFIVYQPLLEKLAERGHHVDVFGHFPRETPLERYTDLSVKGSMPLVEHFDLNFIKESTMLQHIDLVFDIFGHRLCKSISNTTAAYELKNSSKKYDLIITEIFFSDCMLGYAQIFDAPVIGLITSVNLPWASDIIGIPDNPSYIPNYHSPHTADMSFIQRLQNAVSLMSAKLWYNNYAMEISNGYYQKIFEKSGDKLHLSEVVKNISLIMVNSHFSIHGSRPMPPNFVEIGGMHIKKDPILPKHFEKHLQTDLQGIIYVSFGTLFKSELFLQEKMIAIFETLGKVPYKVLWKGDASLIPKHLNIPSNIQFIKWMPQLELLCHPNVTVFISHCGCASVLESTYCGKPILGLPIWGDQFLNANVAVSKEAGLAIPFFQLTKEKFSWALLEILRNHKYSKNAKRSSEVFRDRITSPLDNAVYWTEYVIRHRGAPHLKSKGTDLPWYSYYCLDLILVPIVTVLILCIFMHTLCVRLKKYLRIKYKLQ